jgi:hypothetical protein
VANEDLAVVSVTPEVLASVKKAVIHSGILDIDRASSLMEPTIAWQLWLDGIPVPDNPAWLTNLINDALVILFADGESGDGGEELQGLEKLPGELVAAIEAYSRAVDACEQAA